MWKQFLTLALAVFLLSGSAQSWKLRHLQDQSASTSNNTTAATTDNTTSASTSGNGTASTSDNGTATNPMSENNTSANPSGEGGMASANGASTNNIVTYDLSTNPPGVLPESDSSFGNFAQELDQWYACTIQGSCDNTNSVIDWSQTQTCTLDNGTSCSYNNYTQTVQRTNCSGSSTGVSNSGGSNICFSNDSIISIANQDLVSSSWTWDQGMNARNAFLIQNASGVTINGQCTNGTYCQNLFILYNVSDITINVTCWNYTACDNIISANQSMNVTEWIDCHENATCGYNIFQNVFSNNSYQWSNCSNMTTCNNTFSGMNSTNVTQLNYANDSSVAQHIAVFEYTDGLTQNNTVGYGCVGTNIAQCTANCSNSSQINYCMVGAYCNDSSNFVDLTSNETTPAMTQSSNSANNGGGLSVNANSGGLVHANLGANLAANLAANINNNGGAIEGNASTNTTDNTNNAGGNASTNSGDNSTASANNTSDNMSGSISGDNSGSGTDTSPSGISGNSQNQGGRRL